MLQNSNLIEFHTRCMAIIKVNKRSLKGMYIKNYTLYVQVKIMNND